MLAALTAVACAKQKPTDAAANTTTEAASSHASVPLIDAADLAKLLEAPSGERPVLVHVGFRKLYEKAHIPGSEFIGPTSEANALTTLRSRLDSLDRGRPVIVYCGCCPWDHCPNVQPAAQLLRDMGFKNAHVLHLPHNFETDWAAKGFPVATGP